MTASDGSVDNSIERRSAAPIRAPAGRSRTTCSTATRLSAVENTSRTTPTATNASSVPTAIRARDLDDGLKPARVEAVIGRNASARVVLTISATLTY